MSLLRVAIGTAGLLALTTALADKAPKPAPNPETQRVCQDVPRFGSRIKERVCGTPQELADRVERLMMSGQAAAALSLPPVTETTRPIQ
jgi:hypothetical protein